MLFVDCVIPYLECYELAPKENLPVEAYKSRRKIDISNDDETLGSHICRSKSRKNKSKPSDWSPAEINLFKVLYQVFPHSSCHIADIMMTKSCNEVISIFPIVFYL